MTGRFESERALTMSLKRSAMVAEDIAPRGVDDENVLEAMRTVPREEFVASDQLADALDDRALPIEEGQTISQPLMVAIMVQASRLTSTSRVLEVGAGSGYGAAVLAEIAREVWTVERRIGLAESARERLRRLGYDNVEVVHGDGAGGLPAVAPFDAIVVTAAAEFVPQSLQQQLVDRGRLVIPVGPDGGVQHLMVITRCGSEFEQQDLGSVRFVPLISD